MAIPVAVLGVMWLAGTWWLMLRGDASQAASGGASDAGTERPDAETLLTLQGSNTMGAELAPALAEAFFESKGARDIRRFDDDDPVSTSVVATLPGEPAPQQITIVAHGTDTGFEAMAAGEADIVMASRRIEPTEQKALRDLGDLTSPASEHLTALDGVAVIVSNTVPVDELTTTQLHDILTCEITDWSQVGGNRGPITVYAPHADAGTLDMLADTVLDGDDVCRAARRSTDVTTLARRVAEDDSGIGLVGMAFATNNKVVRLAPEGAVPLVANVLTAGTEDYALSRRLYLYTAAAPAKAEVADFAAFARSDAGQRVVAGAGFVDQRLTAQSIAAVQGDVLAATPDAAPPAYVEFTRGAQRLPLNIRFESATDDLDAKGRNDVERIAQLVNDPRREDTEVLLAGFTDGEGDEAVNLGLSESRSQAVAEALAEQGIEAVEVMGFGEALPVDSNATELGRARNRRVEVWVR